MCLQCVNKIITKRRFIQSLYFFLSIFPRAFAGGGPHVFPVGDQLKVVGAVVEFVAVLVVYLQPGAAHKGFGDQAVRLK